MRVDESTAEFDLDTLYSPSKWVKRMDQDIAVSEHIKFCKNYQEKYTRKYFSTTILYGDEDEQLNFFFHSETQKKQLLSDSSAFNGFIYIFLHGGYWSSGVLVDVGAFPAQSLLNQNSIYCTVEYKLSPPNKINQISESVQNSLNFIVKKFKSAKLVLIGHSAGAHLISWCLSQIQYPNILKTVLVSGIYDLNPIKKSCIDKESNLSLTNEEVTLFSPLNLTATYSKNIQTYIFCGEYDSPAFKTQSKEYFDALLKAGSSVSNRILPNFDHFSIIESLASAESSLVIACKTV